MKKRSLHNLKLRKQTVSKLNSHLASGGAGPTITTTLTVPITYSLFFDCTDVVHTSKDYDGKKCDIATVRDSCFTLCDDKCNDY